MPKPCRLPSRRRRPSLVEIRRARRSAQRMRRMVDSIFEDEHSQRLDALVNYSAATMRAMRVGVAAIGAAHAETAEIKPKHGLKQFHRFLSNKGLDVE